MTKTHFDPIKVKEERLRLSKTADAMAKGVSAADALLWFSEYANSGPIGVARLTVSLVAGSTNNAEKALFYVSHELQKLEAMVIENAIAKAKADFDFAQSARMGEADL